MNSNIHNQINDGFDDGYMSDDQHGWVIGPDDYYVSDQLGRVIPTCNDSGTLDNYYVIEQIGWVIAVSDKNSQLQEQGIDIETFSIGDWYARPLLDVDELPPTPPPSPVSPKIMTNSMDESDVNYSQFLSFLEVDDSFLTPWNWKPDAPKNCSSEDGSKQYMKFQSGSFFAYEEKYLNLEPTPNSLEASCLKQRRASSEAEIEEQRNFSEIEIEEQSNFLETESEIAAILMRLTLKMKARGEIFDNQSTEAKSGKRKNRTWASLTTEDESKS